MILLPIAVMFVVGLVVGFTRALATVRDERARLQRKQEAEARRSMPKTWKPALRTPSETEVHHTTPWYVGG